MRPDLLEEIIKFRGQRYPHLCAWCEHVWDISGESLYDTTLDFSDGGDAVTPVCKLVQGQFELATGSQNNRVGKNYKRVDNGSGYWLVECPFFQRMRDTLYFNDAESNKFVPPDNLPLEM